MNGEEKNDWILQFSIIVPVHNGGAEFKKCISSLSSSTPTPWEIIVVDDGSTDNSAKSAAIAGITVIRIAERGGPAKARNRGAAAATGDILFFVDADVLIPKNTLTILQDIFTKKPHLAAVIGSYDDSPEKENFLSQFKNLFHHYVHQNGMEKASTFWGACGAVRRDVFCKTKGFDEQYTEPSIEDIEFGHRLILSGCKIHLLKTLQVKHLKKWTTLSLLHTDLIHRAIPWTVLIHKNNLLVNDLNIDLKSRASVVTATVILLTLLLTPVCYKMLWISCTAYLILLLINLPLYRFFLRRKGIKFTLLSLPWHLIYYWCCGLGLFIGTIRYVWPNTDRGLSS